MIFPDTRAQAQVREVGSAAEETFAVDIVAVHGVVRGHHLLRMWPQNLSLSDWSRMATPIKLGPIKMENYGSGTFSQTRFQEQEYFRFNMILKSPLVGLLGQSQTSL